MRYSALPYDILYVSWVLTCFFLPLDQAIEEFCKTPSSYSGLLDVTDPDTDWNNSMQSFFFAGTVNYRMLLLSVWRLPRRFTETLKYSYLLFSDDALLPLDRYVLNTEAHPLGILKKAER